ncbi:hypothetical protein ES703_88299 [subsurface metagenome]
MGAYADVDEIDNVRPVGIPSLVKSAGAHQDVDLRVVPVEPFEVALVIKPLVDLISHQLILQPLRDIADLYQRKRLVARLQLERQLLSVRRPHENLDLAPAGRVVHPPQDIFLAQTLESMLVNLDSAVVLEHKTRTLLQFVPEFILGPPPDIVADFALADPLQLSEEELEIRVFYIHGVDQRQQ